MRPATACYACRVGKRRCKPGPEFGNGICLRCFRQKISCSFVPFPRASQSAGGTQQHREHEAPTAEGWTQPGEIRRGGNVAQLMTEELNGHSSSRPNNTKASMDLTWRDEMVNHYFAVVHDTHHSLFQRPTFRQWLQQGEVADVLLFAIVALGSRFTCNSHPNAQSRERAKERSDYYTELAHRSLDMRDVSLTTIQGCILLGTLCYIDGDSKGESVYYATATRLAQILDLPKQHCVTEFEKQINLRAWWTLYMIDIWSSAGLHLPRQLVFREDVELPIEETGFLGLSPETPQSTIRSNIGGIWGEMSRLTYLWAQIQDLNKDSVERQRTPMSLTPEIDYLAGELQTWKDSLPHFLEESPENLRRFAAVGLGTSFAALHLGFHYYHEVLYYQFMAESHQSPSRLADHYAAQCFLHAQAFCDLLYLCERTEGCKCLYAMVGHMLVVTSTVYMHTLLFNKGDERVDHIRERLEHNFEILTELQQHWAPLDTSLARLKTFHNACLYSIEYSFNMDRWMLRFLLEHAVLMPEKFTKLSDFDRRNIAPADEAIVGASEARNLQDWYSQALS